MHAVLRVLILLCVPNCTSVHLLCLQVQEAVSLVPEPVRGRYWELLAHVSGMVDARDPERAEAAWVAYRLLLSQMMAAVKRRATSHHSLTLPA